MAYQQMDPRLRVNRSTAITLTTTFQTIDFSGTDANNVNSFGKDPASGNNMVYWDTINKLFKFYEQFDTNYTMYLFTKTTTTSILTRGFLQYRCVIPNGTSPGVDYIFPFNGQGEFANIDEVTVLTIQQNNKVESIPLYASLALRTNGFYIQMRLSNSLTATCTLDYVALLIQGK